jgi:hypothetical protein
MRNEIQKVKKNFQTEESLGSDEFMAEFNQTLKEELTPMLFKLVNKIDREEMLPSLFR